MQTSEPLFAQKETKTKPHDSSRLRSSQRRRTQEATAELPHEETVTEETSKHQAPRLVLSSFPEAAEKAARDNQLERFKA